MRISGNTFVPPPHPRGRRFLGSRRIHDEVPLTTQKKNVRAGKEVRFRWPREHKKNE